MRRDPALPIVALVLALACVLALPAHAREDRSRVLTFEEVGPGGPLGAWGAEAPGVAPTRFLDSTVVHEGRYAGRLERDAGSPQVFSAFGLVIPIDFKGDSVELRGWLRYEGVSEFVGLWQRQDGRSGVVEFDNMARRGLRGTADWAEYRVVLPLAPKARQVVVGALLAGTGRLWVDDLRVLVDGKPLAEVPVVERIPSAVEADHTFDAGSGIALDRLTEVQADGLVMLAKVWGFLKYHHPAVVGGTRHWDYDLFRVLPAVLGAPHRGAARRAIEDWVAALGEAPPCSVCVELPREPVLRPRLKWLSNRRWLGYTLSERLLAIHARRPDVSEQAYVGRFPAGNPNLDAEAGYRNADPADAGHRLLALFRLWNLVEYWFPYREEMGTDWDRALREALPGVAAARTADDQSLALMALMARMHDTHANLWSALEVRPPRGAAEVPVRVRFLEGRAVVTGETRAGRRAGSGLRPGDVLLALDGVPVDTLVERWRPYYAASNEPARRRDMARALTRGDAGLAHLTVARDGATLGLDTMRLPPDSLEQPEGRTHDLPGPAFRRLSEEVAYLKLSAVKAADVPEYLTRASGARAWILDLRNYPSEFVVFALGRHLVRAVTPFAMFSRPDLRNPGAFVWAEPVVLEPAAPYVEGAVAILVDEVTQSSAEYHAMAFRSRPGAIVVGSTTAGADGNISWFALPGGRRAAFSGLGVFDPDRRPTQRVGIVPDLVVRPTVAGIREGRDEVLEAAIERLLGRPMSEAERAACRTE